jgi:PBP1b-binding outer membrane lipoprotein LpoB
MKHITLMFISALILTGCVYPKKSHTYGNDDFESESSPDYEGIKTGGESV